MQILSYIYLLDFAVRNSLVPPRILLRQPACFSVNINSLILFSFSLFKYTSNCFIFHTFLDDGQGRNDAALMRAIGQALRNLAPSLTYIAPYLRRDELSHDMPPQSTALSRASSGASSTPPIESAIEADVRMGSEVMRAREVSAAMKAMQAFDQRPLKLGVCSNHLGDHSIGRMLAMLLKDMAALPLHPDGSRDEGSELPLVKIWVLDQTPPKPTKVDHVRQFILEHATLHGGHVHLPSFSLPSKEDNNNDDDDRGQGHDDVLSLVQKTVASLELDVLLYPDVGMEPLTFLLSFSRLAPIQVCRCAFELTLVLSAKLVFSFAHTFRISFVFNVNHQLFTNLHLFKYILLFLKAVWWGHPDTTASLALDVFVGLDDELSSAADDQYLEQLSRMTWLNTAPFAADYAPRWVDGNDGDDSSSSHDEEGRITMGESELEHRDTPSTFGLALFPPPTTNFESVNARVVTRQPHIFLVLGRLFKLHPDFDIIVSLRTYCTNTFG